MQGYNFGTAEGYGVYLLSPTGALNMRFQSYGIANRDNGWLLTTPIEPDPTNNFTASPDGSWVATAGNLGLGGVEQQRHAALESELARPARGPRARAQHHGAAGERTA